MQTLLKEIARRQDPTIPSDEELEADQSTAPADNIDDERLSESSVVPRGRCRQGQVVEEGYETVRRRFEDGRYTSWRSREYQTNGFENSGGERLHSRPETQNMYMSASYRTQTECLTRRLQQNVDMRGTMRDETE